MAPGTIRMSADEKRVKILEIFHDTKDFFQLKEIEKLASKKGVVEKTVKDIVQMLVADGLVQSDKIGSSNFFWSFPSARGTSLRNQLSKAQEEHATMIARSEEFEGTMATEQALRMDSPERDTALQEFQTLRSELTKLQQELAQYGQCDPEYLAQKQRACALAKEAALRWTDNVVLARDHFIRLFALDSEEVNQHFGIKIDFDELQ